jgi:hypothetical protein
MKLLALLLLVGTLWSESRADEVRFLVPQYVSMELHKIDRVNDPYLYPRDKELAYGGAFNTNFNLVEYKDSYVFSNNRLSFEQSEITGKIVHGGWRYGLGVGYNITANQTIELGKFHYSYHIFEEAREIHFPTYDSVYLNLVIYKK